MPNTTKYFRRSRLFDEDHEKLRRLRADQRRTQSLMAQLDHNFRSRRSQAKALGVPFSIALEDLEIPELCPVLGIPLSFSMGISHKPSFDRLIPEKGYVEGNVRVISWRANRLKNDATLAELEAIVAYMKESLNV